MRLGKSISLQYEFIVNVSICLIHPFCILHRKKMYSTFHIAYYVHCYMNNPCNDCFGKTLVMCYETILLIYCVAVLFSITYVSSTISSRNEVRVNSSVFLNPPASTTIHTCVIVFNSIFNLI